MIRATLIFCLTILLSVTVVTFFKTQDDRFVVVGHNEGVFIFDRKTTATNYCTTESCSAISTEFISPKQILVAQIPGVTVNQPQPQMIQQHSQQVTNQPLVNSNFSSPRATQQRQQQMNTQNNLPGQSRGSQNFPDQQMNNQMDDGTGLPDNMQMNNGMDAQSFQ